MSETTERVFSSLSGLEGGSDRKQQIALGFGYGIHSCPGAALARIESRIAFEEFRARYPRYRVDERGLRRVHMANVAGFSHVPFALGGRS
jgi:cytochrome P450